MKMTMTEHEFAEKMREQIAYELQEPKANVSLRTIDSYGRPAEAILVQLPDTPNAMIFPVEQLRSQYETEGGSISDVAYEAACDVELLRHRQYQDPHIISPAAARNSIYLSIVNADAAERFLEDVPHEKIGDVAIFPRYAFNNSESMIITNDICINNLRMTPDECIEQGRRANDRTSHVFMPLGDFLNASYGSEVVHEEEHNTYLLTNSPTREGAAVIASNAVLAKVQEELGQPYYILPSSKYEVLVIPESFAPAREDVEGLERMVYSINRMEVKPEDRLSDHIFRYDGRLTQVDTSKRDETNAESGALERELSVSHAKHR